MNHSTLQVNNLSRRHGAFWALRDASFATSPGEILGLIGPNGSGKTTLVECVAGIKSPTSGRIFVDGKDIPPERRKDFLYLVPDGIRPWPDQTVRAVLKFIAALHGNSCEALEPIVHDLALSSLQRARLGELSKGEHRRVMLAIGLLTPQPILMLDEPFDGLDFRQTRDVINVLKRHAQNGRTLFLSIHQLPDAERICDRFLLLSGGRIVGDGTLAQLRQAAGPGAGTLEDVFMALT